MVEHFFAAVEKEFVDTNNVSDILANNSPVFFSRARKLATKPSQAKSKALCPSFSS